MSLLEPDEDLSLTFDEFADPPPKITSAGGRKIENALAVLKDNYNQLNSDSEAEKCEAAIKTLTTATIDDFEDVVARSLPESQVVEALQRGRITDWSVQVEQHYEPVYPSGTTRTGVGMDTYHIEFQVQVPRRR